MTFNVLLAVYVLFGMNENPPIEENDKMSKKSMKSLSYFNLLILTLKQFSTGKVLPTQVIPISGLAQGL